MKTKLSVFVLALTIIVFTTISCKKEQFKEENTSKETPSALTSMDFSSLTTDRTTIKLGEKAKITASATGTDLTYNWKVNTNSTIIGSGPVIELYISCPTCASKPNEVTCTVNDANGNTIAKTITISVQ